MGRNRSTHSTTPWFRQVSVSLQLLAELRSFAGTAGSSLADVTCSEPKLTRHDSSPATPDSHQARSGLRTLKRSLQPLGKRGSWANLPSVPTAQRVCHGLMPFQQDCSLFPCPLLHVIESRLLSLWRCSWPVAETRARFSSHRHLTGPHDEVWDFSSVVRPCS